jgi:hypothetical protein
MYANVLIDAAKAGSSARATIALRLQVSASTAVKWGDWFNNLCLLEPNYNILPAEAEARVYVDNQGLAMDT